MGEYLQALDDTDENNKDDDACSYANGLERFTEP